jgi:hypothetical protein
MAESQIAEYHIADSILSNPTLPTLAKNDKISSYYLLFKIFLLMMPILITQTIEEQCKKTTNK